MRLRFFAPIREFSHSFLVRLVQIDYARAVAFVAIDEASGAMMGAVRLHADANLDMSEYAILLRSDLKGLGLGWRLMQLMIEWACTEGLRVVEGQVLRENTTMLAMCEALGFTIRTDPDDPDMRVVALSVARSGEAQQCAALTARMTRCTRVVHAPAFALGESGGGDEEPALEVEERAPAYCGQHARGKLVESGCFLRARAGLGSASSGTAAERWVRYAGASPFPAFTPSG